VANEIVGLQGSVGKVRVGLFYPIPEAQRIEDPGNPGTLHVPSPSSELEPEAAGALDAAQLAALDAGEALFAERTIETDSTGAALLAKVQALYQGWKPTLLAQYVSRFQYAGKTFDAT